MGHCAVEVTSGQFSEYLSQGLLLCHQLAVWANHSVFVMEWIFISPSNFCVYYKDQSFHSPFHFFPFSFFLPSSFPPFSLFTFLFKIISFFLIFSPYTFLPNQPKRLFPSHYSCSLHYSLLNWDSLLDSDTNSIENVFKY